ncbi:MAG: thioredoxin [Haloplasmataceae bacterium]|jgi:thioredoxin 1|nr:thioredoxin [Haloplasmataceae bacterium]
MSLLKADANNFEENIKSGVVLVDFYADWCGPCKMIAPILEQVSQEYTDVNIVKLNVDTAPTVAEQFGVQSIPTLILFKDGQKVAQTLGFQPKEMLKSWIEKNK